MPIYTYRCPSCKATGTAYRTIAERNRCPNCTQCGTLTEKILTPPMVSVFQPYRSVAADKETGELPFIRSKAEHEAFLRRNGYEEVGNDKSMAPLSPDEWKERRARKLKEEEEARNQPVYDFDEESHAGQLEEFTL